MYNDRYIVGQPRKGELYNAPGKLAKYHMYAFVVDTFRRNVTMFTQR